MSAQPLEPEFDQLLQDAIRELTRRDVGPLTRDRLLLELGLDSLAFNELMCVLEDKLDASIDDEEAKKLQTLGDIEDLWKRLSKTPRAGA